MAGKLIVLEGTDGSGKSTQFSLLCQRLEREGVPFHRLVFPRYQEESSALLRMYLRGDFGSRPGDVNAYAASTFYAVDRYASWRSDWGEAYACGALILADRYTTSNAVHQTPKLPREDWTAFLDWLYDFEYRLLGLPAPECVLWLDMPAREAFQMLRARQEKTGTHADIHEIDETYLALCHEAASAACAHGAWTRVPCVSGDAVLGADEIHQAVYAAVRDIWNKM